MKIATVCSGIGSPEFALNELAREQGFEVENVFACEIDKYARASYNSMHHTNQMFEDMTSEYFHENASYSDIFIGGIPCQAFSLAGKRLGELDPRGLLFFDFYRYVKNQQPKVFIIENVKGLLSDNKGKTFQNWLLLLGDTVNGHSQMFNHPDSLGYNLHHTVLNSKSFGVPQNRERVFIVGIRSDLPNDFRFPKGWKLDKRLKDVLKCEVDEKYYLSDKMLQGFVNKDNSGFINQDTQASQVHNLLGLMPTLSAGTHGYANGYVPETTNLQGKEYINTIRTGGRGSLTDKHNWGMVIVKEATKQGYAIAEPGDSINLSNPNSETRRGRVGIQIANTLDTACNQAVVEPICVAMRGRNPNNPSDRTTGAPTEQRLEPNSQGTTNTITSVQKDNLILENMTNTDNLLIFTRKKEHGKILFSLLEEIGIDNTQEWLFRISKPIEEKKILQQGMYENSVQKQAEKSTKRNINKTQQVDSKGVKASIIMRSLFSEEWQRCAPQRRKSIKQLFREFNEIMQGMPYKHTQSESMFNSKLRQEAQGLWFLRKALSEIQEIRKSNGLQGKPTYGSNYTSRIRRLLPLECWRLQGFSDEAFYKAKAVNSDTQLYKQAGNSITVSVMKEIIRNLLHLL